MDTQEVQEIKEFLKEIRLKLKCGETKKRVHCCNHNIMSYKDKKDTLANAYFNRSIEYEYEGNIIKAMKDVNAGIKICKTNPDLYYHKATLHMYNQQWGIVLNNLNKAIELDPIFTEAIIARNACYARIKESRK